VYFSNLQVYLEHKNLVTRHISTSAMVLLLPLCVDVAVLLLCVTFDLTFG